MSMELHDVLEAGLRAREMVTNTAHVVGGMVHHVGDSVGNALGDALQEGIKSDCCSSNDPPKPADPAPNL